MDPAAPAGAAGSALRRRRACARPRRRVAAGPLRLPCSVVHRDERLPCLRGVGCGLGAHGGVVGRVVPQDGVQDGEEGWVCLEG